MLALRRLTGQGHRREGRCLQREREARLHTFSLQLPEPVPAADGEKKNIVTETYM